MSKKQHQTQNKERREEAKGKELAETRKENQQLRRQVARLTKQIAKSVPPEPLEPDDANVREHTESQRNAYKCGSCGSPNLKSVKMPTGTLTVCKDCQWRKKE